MFGGWGVWGFFYGGERPGKVGEGERGASAGGRARAGGGAVADAEDLGRAPPARPTGCPAPPTRVGVPRAQIRRVREGLAARGPGGRSPPEGAACGGVGASPGRAEGARLVLSRARVLFWGGQDRGDGHTDPPSLCLRTQASQLGGDGRSGPHPRRPGERGQLHAPDGRISVQTGFPTQKIGRLHRSRPPRPRR